LEKATLEVSKEEVGGKEDWGGKGRLERNRGKREGKQTETIY